jgi:hypothetical protein
MEKRLQEQAMELDGLKGRRRAQDIRTGAVLLPRNGLVVRGVKPHLGTNPRSRSSKDSSGRKTKDGAESMSRLGV